MATSKLEQLAMLLPLEAKDSGTGHLEYPVIEVSYDCDNDGVYQWEIEFMALDHRLNVGARRPTLDEAAQVCIDRITKARGG